MQPQYQPQAYKHNLRSTDLALAPIAYAQIYNTIVHIIESLVLLVLKPYCRFIVPMDLYQKKKTKGIGVEN